MGSPYVIPFLRGRQRLLFVVLGIAFTVILLWPYGIPYNHVYNFWVEYTSLPSGIPRPKRVPFGGLGTPPLMPELLCSTWPGEFDIPELTSATWRMIDGVERLASPAFLMLHIPSIATPSARRRRDLIRSVDLLAAVPEAYRHLIELRFVLGYPDEAERRRKPVQEEERELEREQRLYGDLIRLKGLEGGENMDHGKTLEWIRWVGREGRRAAWWVIKCDDDVSDFFSVMRSTFGRRADTEGG